MGDRTTITAWNVASRVTGFVRVVAVAAAVGITYLGNIYQSANLVSNIVFELLAGGLLTVPLVPVFVRLSTTRSHERGTSSDTPATDGPSPADDFAGALAGLVVAGLGAVTVAGLLAAEPIMRLLTAGTADGGIRRAQVELGAALLWLLLPQLVLYGIGAVATALLHAERRFAAAAAAPVANNLVVIATMAAFVAVRDGQPVSLALSTGERLVLGLGTTAGVLAMTLIPIVALGRAGHRLRPRWRPRHPAFGHLGRTGAWGALLLVANQGLVTATLLAANRVEGGVVATQLAYAFFLLPVALLAHPVFTAVHPRLAAAVAAGERGSFAGQYGAALRSIVRTVVPAAAVLAVAAGPALVAIRVGALDEGGAALAGRVAAAYAVGTVGYAAFLLMTRAATASDRADLPGVVSVGVAVGGAVAMAAGVAVAEGSDEVIAVAAAHSAAWLVGAVVLGFRLGRATGVRTALRPAIVDAVAGGVLATAAGVAVRVALPVPDGRPGGVVRAAAVAVAAAGAALVWLAGRGQLRTPAAASTVGARP